MNVKMGVRGVGNVLAELRSIGQRVPEAARKTMHRTSDWIVKEAKLNVPVDTHNLEESIRKEVSYGGRGRLQIDITCGGIVNGVNVDLYALEVHENYEGMTKNGPGPGTLEKMKANPGRKIGSHFLSRAVEEAQKKLRNQMIEAIVKEIRR
jgi:hypothetical protein